MRETFSIKLINTSSALQILFSPCGNSLESSGACMQSSSGKSRSGLYCGCPGWRRAHVRSDCSFQLGRGSSISIWLQLQCCV